MDRERLTALIDDPARVAAGDLADLKDLAARYPWFAGAHFLHAAGAHAGGGVLSDEALRTAAAHIPRRAALHDALHPLPIAPPAPESGEPPVVTEPPDHEVDHAAPTPLPPTGQGPGNAAPDGGPEEDAPPGQVVATGATAAVGPQQPIATEGTSETKAPATATEPPEASVAPTPSDPPETPADKKATSTPEEDELDVLVRTAAMAQGYEIPPKHTGPPPPAAPGSMGVEAPPAGQEATAPAPPTAGRKRFTDWLDEAPPAAPPVPMPMAQPLPPAAGRPVDTGTLIDRFIQQSTPAPQPKTGFFKPQVVAKQSLDDTAGLVTETLAKVHEKQGNYAKAIETYRRLALKYPAKSAYFAALSQALEARLNK